MWEATDLETNDQVAIKLLREDSLADRRLFESEIRMLGQLNHEHIVRMLDAGTLDDRPYLVMEYLAGRRLADLLEEPKPDREKIEWLLKLTIQILSTLEYIHERGIIHGDLKPSNIMIADPVATSRLENGGPTPPLSKTTPSIKLLDFGLARTSHRLTQRSLAGISSGHEDPDQGGTPLYMSPEQLAANPLTERSDLYSLGALLYHLITGRPPFENLSAALSRKPSPPPPDELNDACDRDLGQMILSFMRDAPHKRPANAVEAARMLPGINTSGTRPASLSPRLMRPVFVGREREIELVLDKLETASESGTLQSLRIIGESGSGKSWLLRSSGLKARAEFDSGARTLATSFTQEPHTPGGLGQILLANPEMKYTPEFRERFSQANENKAVPLGATKEEDLLSGSNDQVIAEAAQSLRSMAQQRPLLLVIEDIQYATGSDIDLLERLVAALNDTPTLILLSYRNEDEEPGSPAERLGGRLDRMGHSPPLRLGGLDDNALREYAESVLSPRLAAAPGLLDTLSAQSGGNPLALHRTISQYVTDGSLLRDGDRWDYTGKQNSPGPAGESFQLADSLSPLQRKALVAAGLINQIFDESLLTLLLEDEDSLEPIPAVVASLVSLGLLIEGAGGYRLAPGLDLDPLLDAVSPGRAEKLHGRIAALLLELNPAPGAGLHMRIAEHLEQSDDSAGAFSHYLEAARLGAKDYSNQLSRTAYNKALELATKRDRLEILSELGNLHLSCGEMREALDCLLDVEEHTDWDEINDGDSDYGRIELWSGIARVLHRQGRLDEAEKYFERCLAHAGENTRALAKTCYGLAGLFFDRRELQQARDYFQKSLELYGEEALPRELVPLHLGLALIEKIEDNPGPSISRFKKALALARQANRLLDIARIQGNLANTYRAEGEMSAALEHLEESTRIRRLTGDRQGLAICLNNLARIQTQRGEFQAALETTESALETFEEVGDRKGVTIALCNLGELLLLRGRPREAREILNRCAALDKENEGTPLACNILFNLARIALTVCDHQKAEELFQQCLKKLPRGQGQDLGAHALAGLAELFLQKEMLEAAEDTLQEADGLAGSGGSPQSDAELLGLRMRLCRQRGDLEEAIDLVTAPDRNEAGPYETARIALELGAAYRDLGPDWADKTEKYLGRSVKEFEKMGCPVETSEALGELSIYWYLSGEDEEAGELLQRAETILSRGQLKSRRSRFTETFKTRLK